MSSTTTSCQTSRANRSKPSPPRTLTLYVDDLVAAAVREQFGFRLAVAPDYLTALATEGAIKAGALAAGRPRLNPPRNRRRPSPSNGQ